MKKTHRVKKLKQRWKKTRRLQLQKNWKKRRVRKMRRQNLERGKQKERREKPNRRKKQKTRSHQHQSQRRGRNICIIPSQKQITKRGLPLKSMLSLKKLKILF